MATARLPHLQLAVGLAAVVAPILHTATDAMEWYQHGFSTPQLWLNYAAFLPMPWLLLGIYAIHGREMHGAGLVGALLYGVAFTYFAHTTLVALSGAVPSYEVLWQQLGPTYTMYGAFMVVGGLLFAWAAWRAAWLPRFPLFLFAIGLGVNLILAIVPAPDILQTIGTTIRNAGLVAMGWFVLARVRRGTG